MELLCSPTLLLKPRDQDFLEWSVQCLRSRKFYEVSYPYVIPLLLAARPIGVVELAAAAQEIIPANKNFSYADIIDVLVEKCLLVTSAVAQTDNQTMGLDEWAQKGWAFASHYHFLTLNYEFAPYRDAGGSIDQQRMLSYADEAPDIERASSFPLSATHVALVAPNTLTSANFPSKSTVDLTLELIANAASLLFLPVSRKETQWGGAPMMHKTSPSGGARHPVEGYLYPVSCHGLSRGIYHVDVNRQLLNLVNRASVNPYELAPSLFDKASFDVELLLFLSVRFGRNMYRYREARTFRTIHMDTGHMLGTAAYIFENIGLKTEFQYIGEKTAFQQIMGFNPYEESCFAVLAVGRQHD